MASRIDDTEAGVLPLSGADSEGPDLSLLVSGLLSAEEREAEVRRVRSLRTWREKLVDGLRGAWHGPDPGPLTDEELRAVMQPRPEEDALPERVPPDDPARLAWEAELRSIGVRPAAIWNFPDREPLPRPSVWERVKLRFSRAGEP